MKNKIKVIFKKNQIGPGNIFNGKISNGGNQPPKNNIVVIALIRIIFAYSPKKNSIKDADEYSVKKPATNVASSGDVMLGVALADGSTAAGPILIRGMVRLGAGHIADTSGQNGDALYLSTTAGHVAFGVPSGNGDIARIVGYCMDEDSDIIYFNPSSAYVEVSA